MRGGQVGDARTDRAQQLMHAGERQVSFSLDAGRLQHSDVSLTSKADGLGKQTGLADPRLAVEHQRASRGVDAVQHPDQEPHLGVPAEQGPTSYTPRPEHDLSDPLRSRAARLARLTVPHGVRRAGLCTYATPQECRRLTHASRVGCAVCCG